MAYFSQDPVYTTIAIIAELGEIKPYFSCNEEHKVYFPFLLLPPVKWRARRGFLEGTVYPTIAISGVRRDQTAQRKVKIFTITSN